ncbi:MAG: hypothetical protein KFW09_05450 [Oscillospiraceae bacterium]|nr:hypothetical protein [Oscillospiraceae bacterium]
MDKSYLVDVSIINPINRNSDIRVFDVSEMHISNHMNKHGKMTMVGLISKYDKEIVNKIRKDFTYMFIKVSSSIDDVESLGYPELEDRRRKAKSGARTIFYGFISTLEMKKYINNSKQLVLDIECFSLSKLFDMVEDCAAFTNKEYSLKEIARDLPHCITNIEYNFWGTYETIVQERESIRNADEFPEPMNQMSICYKETPWEFLKRMASRYGASLFNNIDKETYLSTFCLSKDAMDKFIRDFPNQLNSLSTGRCSILSYGSATNDEVYVSGSHISSLYKEAYIESNWILQAGELVQFTNSLIGPHSLLKDIIFFISGVDIILSPDGSSLVSTFHCKERNALYVSPYNNPRIKGVTLFASVLEQRDNGIVVSFGERFKQRDGAPYYPLQQGVSSQSYDDAKEKMYKKLYAWTGYLSCSYTDSNELFKKGRRDIPRLMFKDDPARYSHLAKSLTYNCFKTQYNKFLNFKDEAVSDDSFVIPFHTVSYGHSDNGKVQGAIYMPVTADIVKVFFPSSDENNAISIAVPHMFEPSVANETLTVKKSSIDLPDPRNDINDPYTSTNQVDDNASTLANNFSVHSQNVKEKNDDESFPPISYYGDPRNQHLKVYNDYKKDYIQHKEATIIDRKGLLAGMKKDTMKVSNINNLDNDYVCEGASIHLGGDKGDFLLRSSALIKIRANKKLTLTSKEVTFASGNDLSLLQTAGSKEVLLNENDLTYASNSSDFKNN